MILVVVVGHWEKSQNDDEQKKKNNFAITKTTHQMVSEPSRTEPKGEFFFIQSSV